MLKSSWNYKEHIKPCSLLHRDLLNAVSGLLRLPLSLPLTLPCQALPDCEGLAGRAGLHPQPGASTLCPQGIHPMPTLVLQASLGPGFWRGFRVVRAHPQAWDRCSNAKLQQIIASQVLRHSMSAPFLDSVEYKTRGKITCMETFRCLTSPNACTVDCDGLARNALRECSSDWQAWFPAPLAQCTARSPPSSLNFLQRPLLFSMLDSSHCEPHLKVERRHLFVKPAPCGGELASVGRNRAPARFQRTTCRQSESK